jgi:hypothetical protein
VTLKSLATGVAAVAAIGATAAGVTSIAPVASEVQPLVFGAPMPLEPAPGLPSADEVIGVLNGLADPDVPFAGKSGLVEGGIGPVEARTADKRLQKAAQNGQLPLTFSVDNIAPSGPGSATADVTTSGPELEPRTLNLTFVNQDSWKLSRDSAMTLLKAAAAG